MAVLVDADGNIASDLAAGAPLVRELQADLANATATIGLWQGRTEMLALQLEESKAQLALGVPTNAPESRPGGPERAGAGGMVPDSPPRPPPAPGGAACGPPCWARSPSPAGPPARNCQL